MEKMKRHRLLIAIVVLAVGAVVAWRTVFTQRSTQQSTSPDAGYTATVRSTFGRSGGYNYNIEVRRTDGVLVSHLVVHDKVVGWGRAASLTWTSDSKTVTVGLQDGDTDGGPPFARKRVSIDVK